MTTKKQIIRPEQNRLRYLAGWLLSGLCLLAQVGLAQSEHPAKWQGQVDVDGWAASEQAMPFWLRANQWGTVPLTTPAGRLGASIWKPYRTDTASRARRFDWAVGAQVVGNAATDSRVLLPELYGKVRWKSVELSVGRWRQLTGLGDSTLSSGFINGSGNALPVPKVQLATVGYVPLGFTRKFVALNAGFVHGWFTGAYIQGSYLHQKYLYVRLGKPASRFKGYVGINHEVQWGGQADYLIGSTAAVNGKLPSQFKYYPYVVLGKRPDSWQTDDYSSFDGAYWFGNGLGSTDLGLDLTTSQGTWFLYHQHIYDDFSGLVWQNVPDGLTGLSWRRNPTVTPHWLNRVIVEYLTTMNQSGPTFDYTAAYQGDDNYFNHGQYREGWSYLGNTIGTPFIGPQRELQPSAQGAQFFPNNRLKMLYLGASGQFGRAIDWTLRLSFSQNYGTYSSPYATPYGQLSYLSSVRWTLPRLPKIQAITSIAVDRGRLLPPSTGVLVGLRKNW
ncbi:capsule assembly protein Wzi [Spirosoma oryzae]|uniref:Capsule assembly protein Wzi n=1 Tax=Spirosoma oryzae TaxID=1469603 RepID=A0A2T0SAF9_9BACT|nr:capsule assembly Wzi family protein [Spirosoma oryzae]PRY30406.1 capsule assembly protein Wzi [Spirosoma oryzae]